jgi:hypothetical protein
MFPVILFYLSIEMKKFNTILILILYSAATFGTTVNLHYCCGHFTGLDLTLARHCEHSNKEKQAKPKCCEKIALSVSVDKDQDTFIVDPAHNFLSIPPLFFSSSAGVDFVIVPRVHQQLIVPLFASPPLFIRNCVYRI